MTRRRRPIPTEEGTFPQLCAVSRALLTKQPTLRDASVEWKESIKDRVHHLGYRTPRNDQVYRAMDATERVFVARHAPSPSRKEHRAEPCPVVTHGPDLPRDPRQTWSSLSEIAAEFRLRR